MIRILHMTVVDICRLSSRSLDIPIRYRPDFAALEVLKIAAMVSAEVFVDRMVTMVKTEIWRQVHAIRIDSYTHGQLGKTV